MAKLVWDSLASRVFEAGVSNCVLYVKRDDSTITGEYYETSHSYYSGRVWNGIVSITEKASGGDVTPLYADNIKYLNLSSAEDFDFTIEAYTYPEMFNNCDGVRTVSSTNGALRVSQQTRVPFGLVYKTQIGTENRDLYSYKLHIIYNATCAPSEKAYGTINADPEAILFSWDASTVPEEVEGYNPTARLVVDARRLSKVIDGIDYPSRLKLLEQVLFGHQSSSTDYQATLVRPDTVVGILNGTYTSISQVPGVIKESL